VLVIFVSTDGESEQKYVFYKDLHSCL